MVFLSCFFPSLTNDTHILNLAHVVSFTFDHFASQLVFMGSSIQPYKCFAWVSFGLPLEFDPPTKFYCPFGGIKILGVPFNSASFAFSFL
jgi:hypothetical protein